MEIEKPGNKIEGAERWLSLAGGAAALSYGLQRRGWFGSALALAGSSLLVRGLTGQRRVLEYLGWKAPGGSLPYGRGIKLRRSLPIGKSPAELYRFWRNFENLPRFMRHLESVRIVDDRHSHWVVKAPAGRTLEWDAEIIADRPNEMIGWRSLGGLVGHAGSVRFERAPGGRGAIVRVHLQYNAPAGRMGAGIAKLFGDDPDSQICEDLRRFQELMEEEARRPEPVEEASEESFPASDAPAWASSGGR